MIQHLTLRSVGRHVMTAVLCAHSSPTFSEISAWTEDSVWQTGWQQVTCDVMVHGDRLVHQVRTNTKQ